MLFLIFTYFSNTLSFAQEPSQRLAQNTSDFSIFDSEAGQWFQEIYVTPSTKKSGIIHEWGQQQKMCSQKNQIPDLLCQHWNSHRPKGYAKALFHSPSILTVGNQFELASPLLPNIQNPQKHQFIHFQDRKSQQLLQMGFVQHHLQAILWSIPLDNLINPKALPTDPDRFANIVQTVDILLESCKSTQSQLDAFGNPQSWIGTNCQNNWDIYIQYTPTQMLAFNILLYKRKGF